MCPHLFPQVSGFPRRLVIQAALFTSSSSKSMSSMHTLNRRAIARSCDARGSERPLSHAYTAPGVTLSFTDNWT